MYVSATLYNETYIWTAIRILSCNLLITVVIITATLSFTEIVFKWKEKLSTFLQ